MVWEHLFRPVADALYGPGEQPALVMTTPHKASDRLRVIDLRSHRVREGHEEEDLPQLWYPNVPVWWQGGARYLSPEEIPAARGGKATKDRKKSYPEDTNRFMVLETDTLLLPERGQLSAEEADRRRTLQRQAVLHAAQQSGLPFSLAIDSGHKSVHFVLSFTDSEETLRLFRQRARLNKVADMLAIALGQLDINVCRFFGRGWWGRFPYGWREEQQAHQHVLAIGAPTTTAALISWAERQLTPEAVSQIRSTQRKCTDESRPFVLHRPGWSAAVLSGGEGGRGSGWWRVCKELRRAGSRAPSCITPPTQKPPWGVWEASYLWHLSSYVYHQTTDGWFYSQDLSDYTPQSSGQGNPADGLRERLRWPDDDYEQLQDEQRTYERTPYDPDLADDLDRRRREWPPEFHALVDRVHRETAQWQADVKEKQAELIVEADTKGTTVAEVAKRKRKALSPLEQAAASALGAAFNAESAGGKSEEWNYNPVVRRLLGLDGQPPLIDPRTIRYVPEENSFGWYLFVGTHWINVSTERIRLLITQVTGGSFTERKEAALCKGLSHLCLFDRDWSRPGNNIGYSSFSNGTVVFDFDAVEYVFYENQWWPEHNIRQHIPVTFLENGVVSNRIREAVFRGVKDEMDQEALLQFIGSALFPGQHMQCWGMIEGRGGDGKSALAEFIKHVIGGENYCSIDLHQLGNRFHLSITEGKLLAVDPDANALTPSGVYSGSEQYITNKLKSWTGGDEVYKERKGTKGYSSPVDATLLTLVNEKPYINDTSHGFWRRMRYWFWDAPPIQPHERVINFGESLGKYKEEIDQFRGACFAAFVRACRGGEILVTDNMKRLLSAYQENTDSVAAFVANYLHIVNSPDDYWQKIVSGEMVDGDGFSICTNAFALEKLTRVRNGYEEAYTVQVLYKCYRRFCSDNDMPFVRTISKFKDRLEARGFKIARRRRRNQLTIHGDTPKTHRPNECVINAWCSYEDLPNIEMIIQSGLEGREVAP